MRPAVGDRVSLDVAAFGALLTGLVRAGYTLVGPTVRDAAIVHDRITNLDDLPRGVGDQQSPGRYRLTQRDDDALFGYAVPAHPLKRSLLVPRTTLVTIRRSAQGLAFESPPRPTERVAFVGARACELAAMHKQDRVLRDGPFADADYAARRAGVFVLAVHCTSPAETCFCVSMETGPAARAGYDLAATERLMPTHHFVVDVGTEAGAAALEEVAWRAADEAERTAADEAVREAAGKMGRTLETAGLRDALMGALEHPRWDDVAARCLGCANCTMACPTCFCTTVEDSADLTGDVATRTRRWDSCFTMDFAYVHGGSLRPSLRGRYRQWLTHKLATWHDQFGESGCVGCGRCMTWCPVGIDLTAEAAALRAPAQGVKA